MKLVCSPELSRKFYLSADQFNVRIMSDDDIIKCKSFVFPGRGVPPARSGCGPDPGLQT